MEADIVLFKNKKRKNDEKPVEQVNESIENNGEEKKKKKKKHKKEHAEEVIEAPVESVPSEDTQVEKKKKKKKKHQDVVEPEPVVEEPTEIDATSEKKKKKNKKNKKHENGEMEVEQTNGDDKKKSANGNKKKGFQDYYVEHDEVISMSAKEVNEFRAANNMAVSYLDNSNPSDVFEAETHTYSDDPSDKDNLPSWFTDLKPITKFSQLVLPDQRMLDIAQGFKKPTNIQSQCWPFLLSGKDLIGIAETGSGKTLSFSIPAFVHMLNLKKQGKLGKGPVVLILSPTRELAIQTFEVCEQMGKSCDIRSACFYGGVAKDAQYKALKTGVHVLVATPGRLLDLMSEGVVSLDNVTYMVLDEADRMLDKGFERDIKTILSKTPEQRQTVMFSATWPQSIRSLASTFLKCPIRVTIGSAELAANHKVTQIVEVIDGDRERDQKLLSLLRDYHKSRKNRILIFILYKKEAPRIEGLLSRQGYKVTAIHGDMTQAQRIQAFNSFKDGSVPLMVATDVAARGLDIPDVEYVINYSFPLTIEDYVHRIGRTGRAGKTGTAFTMFTSNDKMRAAELVAILQEAGANVPDALRKLGSYGTKKQEHSMYGHHVKDYGNKPMPKKAHIKFDNDDE